MRWHAYRPRIDSAYDALASEGDRLRVAFFVAKELANRGLADELNKCLQKIGWQMQGDRLIPATADVHQLFFPPQSQHDAYIEIRSILQKATKSIMIVDPYVDQSVFPLLSACAQPGMTIRILTSKYPVDFLLEISKWRAQNPAAMLEIKAAKEFHDRFVVLDANMCWHIGCSIKDDGKKAFMLSRVEDIHNCTALTNLVFQSWNAATLVS